MHDGRYSAKAIGGYSGDFQKNIDENKKIKEIYKKIKTGTATYKDANEFAIEAGEILAGAFEKHISSDALPNGKLYYNIADRVIRPMLENNYEIVADASMGVQSAINERAGIGIKAIKPKINEDKVQGIIDIVSGKEEYAAIDYMLGEPIINFTQSVVDEAVRVNADFQYYAGLNPKIIRTSTGKCCEWCDKLAGVYDYDDVSDTGNPVFRRHQHCKCLVEYDIGRKERQNVHTKKWTDESERNKRIEKSEILKKENLDGMKLEELREVARKTAIEYYKSGISGISFGGADVEKVASTLAAKGNRSSLKKDIISMRKKLSNKENDAIIKVSKKIEGHAGTPKKSMPGNVIDHVGKTGTVETRTFYGDDGLKLKDITTHAHNNPRRHPYGEHGEHAHDYTWDESERLKEKITRELTEQERKENRDIL